MKPKTLLLLMVAVGCGLVAAVLVKFGMTGAPQQVDTNKYLVAVTDFNPGDRIQSLETQLKEQDFVPGTAPAKAFSKADIVAKPDKLLGKVLIKPLAKGEAVTEKHLKDDDITSKVPEGYRAMTIPVKLDTAVAGFSLPTNRVDLIANYSVGSKQYAKIFLQNVLVLAVNTLTDRPQAVTGPDGAPPPPGTGSTANMANPNVITLAVKAEDSERVSWALKQGGFITLVLRKPGDLGIVKTKGTTALESEGTEPGDKKETVLKVKRAIKKGEKLEKLDELFEEKEVEPGLVGANYVKSLRDPLLLKADVTALGDLNVGQFVDRSIVGGEGGPIIITPETTSEHNLQIFNGSKEINVKYAQIGGNKYKADVPPPGGTEAPVVPPAKQPDSPGSNGKN